MCARVCGAHAHGVSYSTCIHACVVTIFGNCVLDMLVFLHAFPITASSIICRHSQLCAEINAASPIYVKAKVGFMMSCVGS